MQGTRLHRRLPPALVVAATLVALLLPAAGCEDPAGGFLVGVISNVRCTTDGFDTTVIAELQYSNIAADRAEDFDVTVTFYRPATGSERTGPRVCAATISVSELGPSSSGVGDFACSGGGVECPTTYSYNFSGVSSGPGSGAIEY